MKKRLKLFFSIFSSCLAIIALCFGVYASIKVIYNVGGNIHYEIDNAYVDIETRVYSTNKLLDYASGGSIVNALRDVNLSNLTSTASSNGLTLKSTHKQTSLGEAFNSSLSTSLNNISYSSTNGYAYFVVVNIKNKTSEIVSAIIEDNVTLPSNSWCVNTGYITGFDNTTTNNNFIFAFGLDNAGIEIESTSFNFVLDIDLGELKPTTTKYTIDETAKTLKINSDATGVVVIGKGNSTATNLQLSSESKNISHVYCFDDCGINSIGEYAFIACTGLTEIIIPESVNSIGNNAFSVCRGLTEITIPESVNSIGNNAFAACSGLTEIIIPESVNSIGNNAFVTCTGLEQITVKEGNTVYHSENNCIIETIANTLLVGCKNSVIPESVNSIGERAFSGCSGLTEITIPESVQSIGSNVFAGCSNLNNVTIDNLTLANSITSKMSLGNFIQSGGTVKVKCSNLSEITSTYLKGSDFIQPSSVVDGYATFTKI